MSNLPEKEKPNATQKQVSLNLLRAVTFLVQFVFVVCCGVFLYALFGDSLSSLFNFKKEPIEISDSSRYVAEKEEDWDKIKNGIHVRTGLVYDKGFEIVNATCTACHSAQLVTQNSASREGWKDMIRWMQETQGLWELGKNEPIILDYLAKHYAPKEVGRRKNIDVAAVEWYILNLEVK